jgi:hypothetical protein
VVFQQYYVSRFREDGPLPINVAEAGPTQVLALSSDKKSGSCVLGREVIAMGSRHVVRQAQVDNPDPRTAAREFHAAVSQTNMELVVFFCSTDYNLAVLAETMAECFAGVQVVGCTSAGTIGSLGYREYGISGASFASGAFTAVAGRISQLDQFDNREGQAFVQAQLQRLEAKASRADAKNSFALLLIDGLSLREELVAWSLQSALGKLPLVGGSAGDGLRFDCSQVYVDGQFHTNSALLVLITTALPFRVFKTQHFAPTDERMVVTEADSTRRIVKEINGLPAVEEYARVVGTCPRDLGPMHFAVSPIVVILDGTSYVRSIQTVNPDGSLTLFCAIEEGLVLRAARGMDLVANLRQSMADLQAELGQPQLILGCDCILRKLEINQKALTGRVEDLFKTFRLVGFNSYGEQYLGIHVNQTLTGIAIGENSPGVLHV